MLRMLLKSDQWLRESHHVAHGIRGVINFRGIPNTKIYALGQPSIEAIDEAVERVVNAHPEAERIIWITLREEPIVYVNGAPFCLRRERFSLRNMKGMSVYRSSGSKITRPYRLWWHLCTPIGTTRRTSSR
jgi:hypothetical protein